MGRRRGWLVQRQPVSSSTIASVGYDPDRHLLEIEFKKGGVYDYFGVPHALFDQLMAAASHGSFFHHHIRNQFQTERVG